MRKLASVITLALCLALAASASAAPRSFFGVVPGGDKPSPSDIERMGRGKVGQVRFIFSWAAVQPFEHIGPNFVQTYDPVIEELAKRGIRAFPTVYGSPGWAADVAKHPPDPAHMDDFENFLRQAAARYGSNGIFWATHPLVPKLPITDWQMWNEVNSPTFWYARPRVQQYKRLLVAGSAGVRSGDPSANVVLAGLFPTPRIRNGIRMEKYLPRLYRTGAKPYFDAVAVHPYALNPDKALASVDAARRIMRRFRDGRSGTWITELGWATSGIRTPLTVSKKKQARYLRKTFAKAARSRKRRRLQGVFWYSFRDLQPRFWIYRTGLLEQSGRSKPSWKAFVRFTGGRPN